MADIVFYEAFEEEEAALRACLPPDISAAFTWKTIQEAGHDAPPGKLVSVRTQSVLPPAWAGEIDGIITRSTGYDHVTAYRRETGAPVPAGYLPLYCNRAVAEQALLLWLSLLRKLPMQRRNFRTFHRDGLTGRETAGRNLTVVGVGNIGHEVARIGRGLDMDVAGVDIVERHDDVTYVAPEEGIGRADILVCAMNLTAENDGYFSEERLQSMRPGSIFVNIARGELSPPRHLLACLEAEALGGVGLDVYTREKELACALRAGEKPDDAHPDVKAILVMATRPDVILTPHNAFNTIEAVERKAEQACRQLSHFRASGEFLWNVPHA